MTNPRDPDATTPSPDHAAAVLAAVEEHAQTLDALREALKDDSETRPTSRYRAAMQASLEAQEREREAVRAWREGGADA